MQLFKKTFGWDIQYGKILLHIIILIFMKFSIKISLEIHRTNVTKYLKYGINSVNSNSGRVGTAFCRKTNQYFTRCYLQFNSERTTASPSGYCTR